MPKIWNFTRDYAIYKGSTFRVQFRLGQGGEANNPIDLSNASASFIVKDKLGGSTLLTLTTANSGITIDGPEGLLTIFASGVATAAYTWNKGVYELDVTFPSADPYTYIRGKIEVIEQIG